MKEYLELGSTPCDEKCAQVGTANYRSRARIEASAYIHLLERVLPIPEELSGYNDDRIRWFPHDFGDYCEVVIYYDDSFEKSVDFALMVEGNAPTTWDKEALAELSAQNLTSL